MHVAPVKELKLILERHAHQRRQRRRAKRRQLRPPDPIRRRAVAPSRRVVITALGDVHQREGPTPDEAVLRDGDPRVDGVARLRGQNSGCVVSLAVTSYEK